MLDPQVLAYLEEVRELPDEPLWETPVQTIRDETDLGGDVLFGEPGPVDRIDDLVADGVPVRLYTPLADSGTASETHAIVFFHGGGWVLGSIRSHDALCRTIAARAVTTVISVEYRLAPEHRFPAAIDDAWTATAWAAERYEQVVVAGDSAGGQLAASVALRARDAGIDLALQVLIYPVTDHAFDTASYREYTDTAALDLPKMRWFWEQYLSVDGPPTANAQDHSPLRAPDLTGVAPALVITAEADPLRDEAEAYAARLRDAGVAVQLHRYPGMIHGFIRVASRFDRAHDAIEEVAAAARSSLRAGTAAD